jgi:hypothetical protein
MRSIIEPSAPRARMGARGADGRRVSAAYVARVDPDMPAEQRLTEVAPVRGNC